MQTQCYATTCVSFQNLPFTPRCHHSPSPFSSHSRFAPCSPQPLEDTPLLSVSWTCLPWTLPINGIVPSVTFGSGFFHQARCFQVIRVAARVKMPFLFRGAQCSQGLEITLRLSTSAGGQLGGFPSRFSSLSLCPLTQQFSSPSWEHFRRKQVAVGTSCLCLIQKSYEAGVGVGGVSPRHHGPVEAGGPWTFSYQGAQQRRRGHGGS